MKLRLAAFFLTAMTMAMLSCDGDTNTCVPGQSLACAGPASCAGFQVCNADGTYDACVCPDATTSSSSSVSATTSGTGTGGGSATSSVGSTGTGGAGGGVPFSPADLPGLSLWLDDDVGVLPDAQHPGTLLKWQDQSGHGHVAAAGDLQDGFRFDIDPIALNGHDAFRCRGGSLTILDHPSLQFGTGPFTIATVVRGPGVNEGIAGFYGKNFGDGHGMRLEIGNDGSFKFYEASGAISIVTATPAINAFHVVVVRGPTLQLTVDANASTGITSTDDISNANSNVQLCSGSNSEIAELVAVKGPLSDVEVAKLRGYLQTKFGL